MSTLALVLLLLVLTALLGIIVPLFQVRNEKPLKLVQTLNSNLILSVMPKFIRDKVFLLLLFVMSPYTASVFLTIEEMTMNKTTTQMCERYSVKNPFNCIHAAALINMGEFTAAYV